MTSLARAADFAMPRPRSRAAAIFHGATTFLSYALIGLASALAITMLLPLAFHGRPLTVMSGSMEPTIHTGDVVVSLQIPPLKARPGDIVSFNDPNRGGVLVTHRVRSMRVRGRKVEFVTKGDANNAVEKWAVPKSNHIGRAVVRIPKLGRGLVFARTRNGLITIVLVPLLLLGILEIASIWKDDEPITEER
jgi:signal peptidase I